MTRSPLLIGGVLIAAALLPTTPAAAAVKAQTLSTAKHAGGITVRQERVTIDGRTSRVTTVTMPKPGRGRALEPYLPDDIVSEGTTTTSRISGELDRYGTAVAINADLFTYGSGQPSGLFMVDAEIFNQPQGGRPALFMGTDGMLGMTTPRTSGVITAGKRKIPFEVNVRRDEGVVLYDYGWGPSAPPGARHSVTLDAHSVQLFMKPRHWEFEAGLRVSRSSGGRLPIPPETAPTLMLAGYGKAGAALAKVKRGTRVSLDYRFGPLPGDTRHGVGGGPILIEDGKIVYERSKYKEFSDSQLVPPDARTAVGQRKDGTVIFYAVDEIGGSAGFTVSEVARDLRHRGVDRAMAFDSGGSTAVSVDGKLLNDPSDGRERQVGNVLVYFRPDKAYREPIRAVRVGKIPVGERVPRLSFALKGRVKADVTLHDPRGAAYFLGGKRLKAGRHVVRVPEGLPLRPGRWEIEVAVPSYQDLVLEEFRVAREPVAAAEADATETETETATATDEAAPTAAAQPAADGDGADGGSSTGWIVGGVALALAIAAAVVLAARRRRPA
ncbi:MAG TPA: phosphodiester glycosidase family protein [Capillimicrobium sp.]